jgi:hypothetical protein
MSFKYLGMCKTIEGKQHKAVITDSFTPCRNCSIAVNCKKENTCGLLSLCATGQYEQLTHNWDLRVAFQEMRETKSGMRALPSHYLTVGKKLYLVEIPDYDLISNPGIMPWKVTETTAALYKESPELFQGIQPDFTTKRAAQAYIDNVLSKKG